MGESEHRIVIAEEFRLVDSEGKVRAMMVALPEHGGEPALVFYDNNGRNRLTMELQKGLPQLSMNSMSGKLTVAIGEHSEGGTTIVLSRENGTLGVLIRVPATADAMVEVFDQHGQLKV